MLLKTKSSVKKLRSTHAGKGEKDGLGAQVRKSSVENIRGDCLSIRFSTHCWRVRSSPLKPPPPPPPPVPALRDPVRGIHGNAARSRRPARSPIRARFISSFSISLSLSAAAPAEILAREEILTGRAPNPGCASSSTTCRINPSGCWLFFFFFVFLPAIDFNPPRILSPRCYTRQRGGRPSR